MIRKIEAQQLSAGMYVHKLGVSWLKHPFLTSRFLIDDPKDIAVIMAAGIQEVWIDTDKGVDVGSRPETPPPVPEQTVSETESPPAARPAARGAARTSMRVELAQAKKLCEAGKAQVASMFSDVRLGKVVSTAEALPLIEEISASVLRNPGALISVARIKTHDEYTYLHSVAVCALMVATARRMGLDEQQVRQAGAAGLMHDLGKAMMPLEVLNKPGKLTDAEFMIMKSHPEAGWKALVEAGEKDAAVLDVVLHHHEKFDGSGYPHQLQGEQISLMARIGAVCDVYDAITSNRPYKSGWCPAESIQRMASWRGHFDEEVFKAFVRSVGIYPVGALVRTHTDKLAVVLEQGESSMLKPTIRVFFSVRSNAPIAPQIVDLAAPGCREKIAGIENASQWGFENLERFWMV
ncbi:HD-GYP domain-containing protein [Denitromonas halophila]|uniref:HD-GYP domain-containing protein n=1 Tax=Denitromonas halophila TaxID=1629404 RepID=A0A557R0U7_9RHOO|nr:HD-GYP domain-containing protein [Denitromonas halophila]TVO58785.1 HD-GYP domain-containing protein [Denitromonas halophila]